MSKKLCVFNSKSGFSGEKKTFFPFLSMLTHIEIKLIEIFRNIKNTEMLSRAVSFSKLCIRRSHHHTNIL